MKKESCPIRLDRIAFMTEIGEETKISLSDGAACLWLTEDESIASVGEDGTVRAMGDGDTRIWAVSPGGEKASCLVSVGYTGKNPLLPPTWGLFIADGEPHVFDGTMYIYGSRDNPYGKDEEGKVDFCSSDYHVIYSRDLIHWTDGGVALEAGDVPGNIRLLWAPDLFRDPGGDKFYLVFCSTDEVGTYFIGESRRPEGPFANIREITYRGGKIGNIDPGILVDNGRVYMAMPKPFRIGELDRDADYAAIKEDSLITVDSVIANGEEGYYGFEGPSLRKFGDLYYFIYIASPRGERHPIRMNYLISRDIRGEWRFGGTILDASDYLNGINVHGSIERFRDKFYLSYHKCAPGMGVVNRHGRKVPMTRELNLEEIIIECETGKIEEALITTSGVRGVLTAGEKIYSSTAVFFSERGEEGRFIAREIGNGGGSFPPRFSGYPFSFFDRKGQFLGYRYLQLSGGRRLAVRIKTEAPGAVLSCIDCEEEMVLGEWALPDTAGEWEEVHAPLNLTPEGKREVRIELGGEPAAGRVYLDWFIVEP